MYRILLAILLCLAIGEAHNKSEIEKFQKFPDNFKFGVSTTAYQIEGAWNEGGKGESIWDHAVHNEPHRIKHKNNGDVACDSYHLYERDVEMLRELDVDFYRFSISWPRILPTGFAGVVSTDGVAYYNNLINELVKYNITPVVTMYGWDLPQSLQDLGGWVNPSIKGWFESYSKVLFEEFGDRVKNWITINSPHAICHEGYGEGKLAPFIRSSGIGEYHCSYNLVKAHATVYNLYKKYFKKKQNGSVGISVQIAWPEALTMSHDDAEAVEDYKLFEHGIYLNPILKGDFPSKVKEKIAKKSMEQGYNTSRLPKFTREEVELVKGTADFIGLNHYTTISIYRNSSLEGKYEAPSWLDDFGGAVYYGRKYRSAASNWLKVNPSGIRKVLNYLKDEYGNPEIMIVENGYSTKEELRDSRRIQYIRNYLTQVLKAVSEDRVNVSGYAVFSLMDNFEWTDGFDIRFGLYEVDYSAEEKERTARQSALIYKEIISSRVIDYSYRPNYYVISKKKTQVEFFKELTSSSGLNLSDKQTRTFAQWIRKNMLLPLIKGSKNEDNGTVNEPNISVTTRIRNWQTNKFHSKQNVSNSSYEVDVKSNKTVSKISDISNTQQQNESKSEYIETVSINNGSQEHYRTDVQKELELSVNKTRSDNSVTNGTNKWQDANLRHLANNSNIHDTQENIQSTTEYILTTPIKIDTLKQNRTDSHKVLESSVNISNLKPDSRPLPKVSIIDNIRKRYKSKSKDVPTTSVTNNTSEQKENNSITALELYVNRTQPKSVSNISATNNTNIWQETKLDHASNDSNTNNTQEIHSAFKSADVPTISVTNNILKQNRTDSYNVTELFDNKTKSERLPSILTTIGTNITVANATQKGEESKFKDILNVTFTNSTTTEIGAESNITASNGNNTLLGNETKTVNLPNFLSTNGSLALNETKFKPKIDLSKQNQTRTFHTVQVINDSLPSDTTNSENLPKPIHTISNVTKHSFNQTSSDSVRKVSTINATHVHNATMTERVQNNNYNNRPNQQNRTNSESGV